MNASSFVYIDVVIICTMMSFYQQILHSFSCYKVLCIGNLTYAGHFAVCPSTKGQHRKFNVFDDIFARITIIHVYIASIAPRNRKQLYIHVLHRLVVVLGSTEQHQQTA